MSKPFTTDQLMHALDQLHGVGNAVKLEFLRMLDDLDRSECWREDGATSIENWVSYRYAMTWQAASDHVMVMRALRDRPSIASAFGVGMISWEVLVMLCSFVEPEADEEWADRAQRVSPAVVRMHVRMARRLKREDAARVQRKRYLHARWDKVGDFLRLNGLIPGAEGALVRKALDRIADQLGPNPNGVFEPYEQRRADALVELAGKRIANDSDPDRATLVVHVDARELNHINGQAFIEDGPVIPSEVARRLGCDARIEIVVRGKNGSSIGVGRVSRIVPPKLMRQLKDRDQTCVVCGRRAGVHAHHRIHWAHGGRTDLDNLDLVCRRCHRLLHEGGFKLVRDRSGRPTLVRPDGRTVSNRPAPLRPDVREHFLGPAPNRRVAVRC